MKPTTVNHEKFILNIRKLLNDQGHSNTLIRTLESVLRAIESKRLGFSNSSERCFSTRATSNADIALQANISIRYLQKCVRILEKCGVIQVIRRKINNTMSFWNKYRLVGFKEWLSTDALIDQQDESSAVHAKEENNLQLLFKGKIQSRNQVEFPKSNITTYSGCDKFWVVLADEALSGVAASKKPCLSLLSSKFRQNLNKLNVEFDDKSIISRWISFVRRSKEFIK